MGDLEQADGAFRDAYYFNPNHLVMLSVYAGFEGEAKQNTTRALELLRRSISLKDTSPTAWFMLARFHQERGEADEAERAREEAPRARRAPRADQPAMRMDSNMAAGLGGPQRAG